MSQAVDRLVERLPLLTRAQAVEEAERDPAFWSHLAKLAVEPLPERAVDRDMTKALLNELDPARFPETRGKWPMLRAHLRTAVMIATVHAPKGARAVAGLMRAAGFAGGLDQWAEIASAVSAVGTAASGAYSLYLQKRLQDARAAAEKRAREREAARLRAEQEALAKAQAAAAASPVVTAAPSRGPSWATWAIVAVLGLLGIFAVTRFVKTG